MKICFLTSMLACSLLAWCTWASNFSLLSYVCVRVLCKSIASCFQHEIDNGWCSSLTSIASCCVLNSSLVCSYSLCVCVCVCVCDSVQQWRSNKTDPYQKKNTYVSFVAISSFSLLISAIRPLTSFPVFSNCVAASWFILFNWTTWACVGNWAASGGGGVGTEEEEEVRTALGLEMRVWIVDTVSTYLALWKETNNNLVN